MAVYKKSYHGYDGPLTATWSRFLILPRYTFEEMRGKRFFTSFFLATLITPLVCALIIYLHHNFDALEVMGLKADQIVSIDAQFFGFYLGMQSMLAFFLTAFVGPGLVSPDLANNAIPLYLARPFDRKDYVLGKMSVLAILLSLMTWIPGLLLYFLQGYLEGAGWITANARLGVAVFLGSWIWIIVLSLLVLALSAWVKWKPVAGGLLFVVFFAGGGFGAAINEILHTRWGNLINLSHLLGSVWVWLFKGTMESGGGAPFFGVERGEDLPIWTACIALTLICLGCLKLLAVKIRGMEVVR
jgi:ABC-2 type transport system permease protein